MRPSKTAIEQRDSDDIDSADTEKYRERPLLDVVVITSSAALSLTGLIALGYCLVSTSLPILVPFVVGAALPLFTLFAIVYQAVVYRRQWHSMEQARRQTERVIRKMQNKVEATERQETILRDQAEKMGLSIIVSNKASVGIHSIEYSKETGLIIIKIENIGLVPAERIDLFLEVVAGVHSEYVELDRTPTSVRGFLRYRIADQGYGSTKLLRGNLQITKAFDLRGNVREKELDLIEHGHANLSVRGWINYEDGFMQGRQQTDFFFWYKHIGDIWTADDPVRWGAHFDMCGPADNEGWQDEASENYQKPN
jgi:hypothetical protein